MCDRTFLLHVRCSEDFYERHPATHDNQIGRGEAGCVRDRSVKDNFTKALENEVLSAISNEKWRCEYMTFNLRLMDERIAGRQEGRIEVISNLLEMEDGETIARNVLHATDEEIEQAKKLRIEEKDA